MYFGLDDLRQLTECPDQGPALILGGDPQPHASLAMSASLVLKSSSDCIVAVSSFKALPLIFAYPAACLPSAPVQIKSVAAMGMVPPSMVTSAPIRLCNRPTNTPAQARDKALEYDFASRAVPNILHTSREPVSIIPLFFQHPSIPFCSIPATVAMLVAEPFPNKSRGDLNVYSQQSTIYRRALSSKYFDGG